MNKLYKTIFYATLCVALAVGIYAIPPKVEKAHAIQGLQIVSTNTSNPLATTTVKFLPIGSSAATTTLTLSTYNVDQIGLNIAFSASSSPNSVLNWRYEYSLNNLDWYSQGKVLNDPATTTVEVRDAAINSWVYATSTAGTSAAAVAFKHVDITNLATPYFRIVFFMQPGSTPGGIYAAAVLKQNVSN